MTGEGKSIICVECWSRGVEIFKNIVQRLNFWSAFYKGGSFFYGKNEIDNMCHSRLL